MDKYELSIAYGTRPLLGILRNDIAYCLLTTIQCCFYTAASRDRYVLGLLG